MNAVFYEFDKIINIKKNAYVFQYVHSRKLSDICHYHDFYEIIYIVEGQCEQEINGEKTLMEKGDTLLLRPMESHVFLSQSDYLEILCLSVKKDEFARVLDFYNTGLKDKINASPRKILFSSDRKPPELNSLLLSYDENDCKLLLCAFLNMYLHMSKNKEKIPKSLLFAMSEMKKDENLKRGVRAFIEISSYSQSHLTRLMKKYYNMNIHDYIMNVRLEKAYKNIIFTKNNLEEISESVGYNSFSHFNKIFTAKYSITPAMLRKQHGMWTT